MRRLAIFAHYDADNRVRRYILYLLEQLHEECEDICFVSTSELPRSELDKLRGVCSEVMLKDNVGLDFGMWQHALERLDLASYDELVLVNSSIFGPIRPLGPIFRRMDSVPCDFWGITDNVEIAWHLQSYFLVFKQQVLRSPAFARFWQSVLPYRDKDQVIRSYEVGLTIFLREAGFVAEPVVPMDLVLSWSVGAQFAPKRWSHNPTSYHPVSLIEAGCPFVKVELLRDNIAKIPLEPVYRMVAEAGYDMTLIEFDRPPKQDRTYPPWPERANLFVKRLSGALAHTIERHRRSR